MRAGAPRVYSAGAWAQNRFKAPYAGVDPRTGRADMCRMCDDGRPQDHARAKGNSRRDFLKTSTATAAATGLSLLGASSASAKDDNGQGKPQDGGKPGRQILIRGGAVMSMDKNVGDFPVADVLIDGKKIVAVQPNIKAPGAQVIDAGGKIVMP